MKRFILALALILSLFATILAQRGSATTVEEDCLDTYEAEFLTLINDYRAANGIGPLRADQRLGAAAQHHSDYMARTHILSHYDIDVPDLDGDGDHDWLDNIVYHGYTAFGRGENIAWGYTSPQAVFNAWKASPDHNRNMLQSGYTAIGVGLVIDPNEPNGWFWTTTFGSKLEQSAVPCGSNTPTPAETSTPSAPTATPGITDTPPPTATPAPTNTPKACKWGNSWRCDGGGKPGKGLGNGAHE